MSGTDAAELIRFEPIPGEAGIAVRLVDETVWLSQAQLVLLFERDKSTISEHLQNVFNEGELDRGATVRNFRTVQLEGSREVERTVEHYNLDVIISVGYRVKSRRGTQFRIWATQVLKQYLEKGYAIDRKLLETQTNRLQELSKALTLLEKTLDKEALSDSEARQTSRLIGMYSKSLLTLEAYDNHALDQVTPGTPSTYQISYEEARAEIDSLKQSLAAQGQNINWFGNEKDDSFRSSLATIYQSFAGQELYPTLEAKAANLLYLVVKNHSFTDGNKRIAAYLAVYFLSKNNALTNTEGNLRVEPNALVATTLLVATSKPEDKDLIVRLVEHLLSPVLQ
ncbi:MAG: virulence protein RhuM/Fic/DOC family protein [Bacteroidia bacterium]|nr:virulence protein RhuM/Fic/DOC family protein [Bacteroidia bacterium]